MLDKVSLFCYLASYAVALALELTQFLRRSPALRWSAMAFTAAGFVAHTAYLIVRSRHHDLPPLLGSPHDWLLVFAWMMVALYLGVQIWNPLLSLGVFALPLILLMVGASEFVSMRAVSPVPGLRFWGMLHASFWVFGMLGGLLALIVSLMYLVKHYRLKHKLAELPALRLFSLERLSRMNWWLIVVSVPLLTLGMVSGFWLIYLSRKTEYPVDLMSMAVLVNGVVWGGMALLFGWLLADRHRTGRVVAWRTFFACLVMLVTAFAMVATSSDQIHNRIVPAAVRGDV